MPSQPIDPSRISANAEWEVFEITPDYRRSRLWLSETQYIVRTEYLADDTLIRANEEQRDASRGMRVGEWTKVGSIPLNLLYSPDSQIAEKMQEGDRDHLKWFLNGERGKPYKTWWGDL